jgi:hypothetical protein
MRDLPRSIARAALYPSARPIGAAARTTADSIARVRLLQRYRLRTPSTGREIVLEADPDREYVDRETGEDLEVVAILLPLAPTPSELPWAVDNLRFCNWCDQLSQKDLNDCPYCGRRMEPLDS